MVNLHLQGNSSTWDVSDQHDSSALSHSSQQTHNEDISLQSLLSSAHMLLALAYSFLFPIWSLLLLSLSAICLVVASPPTSLLPIP